MRVRSPQARCLSQKRSVLPVRRQTGIGVGQFSQNVLLAKMGTGITNFLKTMPYVMPPVRTGDPATCAFQSLPHGLHVVALVDLEKLGFRHLASASNGEAYERALNLWRDKSMEFFQDYGSRLPSAAQQILHGMAVLPCLSVVPTVDSKPTTKAVVGILLNKTGAGLDGVADSLDVSAKIYAPQVVHRFTMIPPRVWEAVNVKLLKFWQDFFKVEDLGVQPKNHISNEAWVRTFHFRMPLNVLTTGHFSETPSVYEIQDLWHSLAPKTKGLIDEVSGVFEKEGCLPLNLDAQSTVAILGNQGDLQVVFALGVGFFGIEKEKPGVLVQSLVEYTSQYLRGYQRRN